MPNPTRRDFLEQTATAGLAILSLPRARAAEPPGGEAAAFARAAESARIVGISLTKVQRWLREVCLPAIDKETVLYRAVKTSNEWNYHDSAADCYPFVVWAAFFTDLDALNGPMHDILRAEQKLCNHLDRLPVDFDMARRQKLERPLETIIFGAAEYAKDGLTAIVELTGKEAWYERFKGIVEDIFKHAAIETPYGKIPTKNIEVNGNLLQMLPRLYSMTGDRRYLD